MGKDGQKEEEQMNKKGGFTDLFIFIIVGFVLVVCSGIFIYIGSQTETQLHATLDPMDTAEVNNTEIIDDTFADVGLSFGALIWISWFIIIAMIFSIFIGSYLVTTKPIFFIPYFIITAIAIILSVGISNSYEQIVANETLHSTYVQFIGANFFLANLPIWVTVIAGIGAIIMFSRMGSRREEGGGYYGG